MEYKLVVHIASNPSGVMSHQRAELQHRTPIHTLQFQFWRFTATDAIPARLIADGNVVFDSDDQPISTYTRFFLRSGIALSEFLQQVSAVQVTGKESLLVQTAILSFRDRLIQICDINEIGWWWFYFNEEERAIIEENYFGNVRLKLVYHDLTLYVRSRMDGIEMEFNAELLRRAERKY